MFSVNKKEDVIQLTIGAVPAILSVVFMTTQIWWVLVVCVISMFVIIGVVPIFKKRENLYMFIFVAISGTPINIRFSYWLVSEEIISLGFLIGDILWAVMLCFVFFSLEEIVFGIITRLIWKRQYKLKIY